MRTWKKSKVYTKDYVQVRTIVFLLKTMFQKLVVTGEISSFNRYISLERSNRFAAAALKKTETAKIAMLCKQQKLLPQVIEEVWFIYYHSSKRKDYDNTEYNQKYIWDGLVVAGIIPNDTQEFTPKTRIHQHRYDKSNPRIEVFIHTSKVLDDSYLSSV